MNNRPLISIVTVTYNAVNFIEKTIKSVIEQSYSNIEYIIVDGNSNDGTLDIINKYIASIDIVVSEIDKGIYDAMNKALKIAKGDFLLFLNAGDLFVSNMTLIECANFLCDTNKVYYGNVYYTKQNSPFIFYGNYFTKNRLMFENICHQSIFYPQNIYKNSNYSLKYKYLADWAYNIKAFKFFVHIPVVVAYYDTTGVSSIQIDYAFYCDKKYLIKEYWGYMWFIKYLFVSKIKRIFNR